MSLVEDDQIKSSSLSNPLPLFFHLYIWPFVFVWPAFSALYLSQESYDKYIGGSEWTFVWLASLITVQGLIWLSTFWSVEVAVLFTSLKTKTVEQAKEIKLIPVENAGKAEICKLERDDVGGKKNVSFVFQRRRFIYNTSTGRFAPLTYALDAEPKPSIGSFQNSRGLTSEKKLKEIQDHYGDNTFDIPVPTFTELFKEHAVAPFFIFQLFCVGLWLLDDYWYYSLFTLFMLVVFESTVVWQRQRTMKEFRGMGIKPYAIWVHRSKGWEEIQSDKLLPGDLVSLGRTKEDSGVACDMLLVEGTAILNEAMLSGESTPVLKDSVQLRPADALIEPDGLDKNAFVWGGTKVLQITHGQAQEDDTDKTLASGVKPPPDNGAMAIIVKTGFETSQGSLVRTMMFSTERVSANNAEALLFILFLLVFAIAASWYVWTEGVIKNRKRSKLLLDCILIITSVVPPELPMELSLAVNTSLAALSKLAIFCTEPFRIPFAGRVDIACFDKTGTLTGEDLVVEGIAGLEITQNGSADHASNTPPRLVPVSSIPDQTTLVLATAHALVKLEDGDVVGEPMEKATLSSLKWRLGDKDTLTSKSSHGASVQIKRRFQFSSALKRQSSVANITVKHPKTGKPAKSTFIGVKGAPETIQRMLVKTPSNYEDTFKYFSRNGSRVLALAYKHLSTEGEVGQSRINNLKREEVESELSFAGFLVLTCPLKEDAAKAVRMLNESSHRTIMITGDNPLTAVYVARQVEIIDREALILDAPEDENVDEELVWRSVDEKINMPCNPREELDERMLEKYDLCVTGLGLAKFKDQKAWNQLLKSTYVYARVSPKQKEDILIGLRNLGYTTLMCGDGTNDVGALKQAHIGVALLNGSQDTLNRISESWKIARMRGVYDKQVSMMQRFNQPTPPVPIQIAHVYPPGPTNPHYEKAMQREAERMVAQGKIPEKLADQDTNGTIETITSPRAQALQQAQNEEEDDKNLTPGQRSTKNAQKKAATMADQISQMMMTEGLDDDEPPTLKLGDASAAAPFTSKLANVVAIPNIIRQGRCTLVATIQMYKILALNCLISAYSLSVLYLDGIKFGDGQVTISGMLMSVCFLSISRAKPVEALSKERAHPNIFNPYIILSVLGQFAIHIVTLIYIKRFVATLEPPVISFDPDAETEFEPSLLNSAIYLLQLIQQISTFAVNYQGRPFRESISENKGMYYGILMVTGVAFSCATEFVPEINEKLKLVPFIMPFKIRLTATMFIDFAGCWVIEKTTKYLFGDFRPKDIAKRRPDQIEAEEKRKDLEKKDLERKALEEEARKVRELEKAGR